MGDTRTVAHDQFVVLVKTRALRETALEAKVAFFARPRRAPACFRNPGRGAVIRLKNHLVSTLWNLGSGIKRYPRDIHDRRSSEHYAMPTGSRERW